MAQKYTPVPLRRLVRARADERCEYCLIPEAMTLAPHWVDHIVAEKHGGRTEEDNLALSCVVCNQRKGSDLTSIDPESGQITPLFHPAATGGPTISAWRRAASSLSRRWAASPCACSN